MTKLVGFFSFGSNHCGTAMLQTSTVGLLTKRINRAKRHTDFLRMDCTVNSSFHIYPGVDNQFSISQSPIMVDVSTKKIPAYCNVEPSRYLGVYVFTKEIMG